MPAYYNENDPFAAQWLRNLIAAGHIAPGDVDERSIVDVQPDDLAGYTQCHFFAGIGGWSYALRLARWPDERPVWTGSCPCQPFSLAGKQKGFDDARHLWPVWRELIAQRSPAIVFGEQVASATEWLGLVRGDLEALGYAVGAMPVQAASAGADHLRDRYWFVASDMGDGRCAAIGINARSILATETRKRSAGTFDGSVPDRSRLASAVGLAVADSNDARSQGRQLLSERAGERLAGSDGVADADSMRGQANQDARRRAERGDARSVARPCGCDIGDMGFSDRERRQPRVNAASTARYGNPLVAAGGDFEWVIGADGKARRVKSGLRLLAHGVSGRVGKLRGFGNAIDPRPAAQFIAAAVEAIDE